MLTRRIILIIMILSLCIIFPTISTEIDASNSGQVWLYASPAQYFSYFHDTTTGYSCTNNQAVRTGIQSSTTTSKYYSLQRGYIVFDTSELEGVSSSAILRVYISSINKPTDLGTLYFSFVSFDPANPSTITTSDYNLNLWGTSADEWYPITDYSAPNWYNFTIPNDLINIGGTTVLGLRTQWDASNTAPTWASGDDVYFTIAGTNAAQIPELYVETSPLYDTNLSASGMFCSYNNIDFNLSITPYNTSGYFEIYIYKDSPSYLYAGDTGTDTGWFTYSKTLPSGNYYTQGFVTPDDEEESWGEWLNFTMLTSIECSVAPNGTISSDGLNQSWRDILTTWNITWSNITPYSYTGPTSINDTFVYWLWDNGYITDDEFANYTAIWDAANNDTATLAIYNLQDNMTVFSTDIIGEIANGSRATRASLNTSHGILSNYTTPITTIGGYAMAFIPGQIIDLITALLVVNLGFLILWSRK